MHLAYLAYTYNPYECLPIFKFATNQKHLARLWLASEPCQAELVTVGSYMRGFTVVYFTSSIQHLARLWLASEHYQAELVTVGS